MTLGRELLVPSAISKRRRAAYQAGGNKWWAHHQSGPMAAGGLAGAAAEMKAPSEAFSPTNELAMPQQVCALETVGRKQRLARTARDSQTNTKTPIKFLAEANTNRHNINNQNNNNNQHHHQLQQARRRNNNNNRAATSRMARLTTTTIKQRPIILLMLACGLILLGASLGGLVQFSNASMCQYHQAILDNLSSQQQQHQKLGGGPGQADKQLKPQQQQQHQGLIVCPKSSQHNNLPQPFHANSKYQNANFERQQRAILKSLNESFANHLQLNAAGSSHVPSAQLDHRMGSLSVGGEALLSPAAAASDLIDDELLNEIISPVIVDEAYQRAKEMIVKRRKLETELIKQGECRFVVVVVVL